MNGEKVFLGLGSNLGDRRAVLEAALEELSLSLDGFRAASFYETEPLYVKDQGLFLNTVAEGFYAAPPEDLLALVQAIEKKHGRKRSAERRWGERTLDIDILLFGSRVIHNPPLLEIPHPRLRERAFALVPLLELDDSAKEPHSGLAYGSLLKTLSGQGVRRVD
ncbi:MAG: 2-amino-4-hydroxy-6-hydroxymethyldihydropteridine diphosphokinase [Spirochaetaceae bacterium]|nr:2-amino-4-hydroxy-6-hydroxymethyldihydropteridine diphosphokinase [Spirochaetaceae bacterium]